MSITYTWKITGLKTKDQVNDDGVTLQGAVVQTFWQKIGVNESGVEGTFSGATPFSAAEVPEGSFTPFNTLTEEVVLSWIKKEVVGDYEAHVNSMIQQRIDEKEIVEADLPWAPADEADSAE